MNYILKRTIKTASYGAMVVAGLFSHTFIHNVQERADYTVTQGNTSNAALLVGIAHADVPMCGAYACGSGGSTGASDGGGDCGDGGSGDDCN